MVRPKPWIKFTVKDYMSAPEDKRYQLLDGEMILAPSPTSRHQTISAALFAALRQFIASHNLGRVWYALLDVVLSDHDVAQPDILFVSNARSAIITEANIQGGPDLVVEILSPRDTLSLI
jgi:Uma2 family endonuclease